MCLLTENDDVNQDRSVIIVVRHGERLDYALRDSGSANWVATAKRPYDSPLTNHGEEQAATLGRHLASELKRLGYPSASTIYSSPLLRCRQTAAGVRLGLGQLSTPSTLASSESDVNPTSELPICVEIGLMESIDEDWYRSWSLPGSDGTWGYRINRQSDYEPQSIHPMALQPIQSLLHDWKMDEKIDQSYESKSTLSKLYCFYPAVLETRDEQRSRMVHVANSVNRAGRTILLVSHGGPVTHLYEEIMGEGHSFSTFGEATYCSYSIYVRNGDERRSGTKGDWEAVAVNINQSTYT